MSKENKVLRSSLSNARGLGSAKDGTAHWWWQRVTALALIPLSIWLVYSLLSHVVGAERSTVALWLADPLVCVALLASVTAMLFHAKLGIQVILEDYVHCPWGKYASILIVYLLFPTLILFSWVAIVKLHFMGA